MVDREHHVEQLADHVRRDAMKRSEIAIFQHAVSAMLVVAFVPASASTRSTIDLADGWHVLPSPRAGSYTVQKE